MKSTDVLRHLIKTMGQNGPELDEALRISALAYLDKLDPPEQKDEKPEQKDKKPEQKDEKTSASKKKNNLR